MMDGEQVSNSSAAGHARNTPSAGGDEDNVSTTTNNECMVCSDRATGLHYSVNTCEGCKGFFKRSVQKQLKYTCRGAGQPGACSVTKESRNNCQHCRFKKCLSVGMKVDAVREDRMPGGRPHAKRQKAESSSPTLDQDAMVHSQATCSITESEYPSEQPGEMATSSDVDDSSRGMNSLTEEKTREMMELLEQLRATRPDIVPVTDSGEVEGQEDGASEGRQAEPEASSMMQNGYKELQLIIKWAKKVPGFSQLHITDQMCLLKSSFLELNILRLAYRSMATYADKVLHFGEGLNLTDEETVRMGWDTELVQSTLLFAKRLAEIDVDFSDFCLLNALVLSFPDAMGLEDKEAVQNLQARYMDCFYAYCQTKRPQETKHYGQMLLRLQALRSLSAKAANCFFQLIDNGTLPKDDLAQEMFVDSSFTSL